MAKQTEKLNQMTAVKQHLIKKKTITSMQAFELYGCTRLSAKIFDLRRQGWDIATIDCVGKTRYGDTCTYAKYRLISRPNSK